MRPADSAAPGRRPGLRGRDKRSSSTGVCQAPWERRLRARKTFRREGRLQAIRTSLSRASLGLFLNERKCDSERLIDLAISCFLVLLPLCVLCGIKFWPGRFLAELLGEVVRCLLPRSLPVEMPAPAGRDAPRIHAGTRAKTPGLARWAPGRASGDAGPVPVPSRSTAASGVSRPRAGTARSGAPTPGTVSPRGREERAACDEDVGEAQAGRGDRGAGQSSSGRGRRTRGWRAGWKGPGRRPRLSCGGRQSARLSTWSHE